MKGNSRIIQAMEGSVLIIEDTVHDLSFYRPLFERGAEISFLFVSPDRNAEKGDLFDSVDLLFGDISRKIKEYAVTDPKNLGEKIGEKGYGLYIFDSLKGLAEQASSGLPKDRVAFFSSTESFRNAMAKKGYRTYRKSEISELISDFGL